MAVYNLSVRQEGEALEPLQRRKCRVHAPCRVFSPDNTALTAALNAEAGAGDAACGEREEGLRGLEVRKNNLRKRM